VVAGDHIVGLMLDFTLGLMTVSPSVKFNFGVESFDEFFELPPPREKLSLGGDSFGGEGFVD